MIEINCYLVNQHVVWLLLQCNTDRLHLIVWAPN